MVYSCLRCHALPFLFLFIYYISITKITYASHLKIITDTWHRVYFFNVAWCWAFVIGIEIATQLLIINDLFCTNCLLHRGLFFILELTILFVFPFFLPISKYKSISFLAYICCAICAERSEIKNKLSIFDINEKKWS